MSDEILALPGRVLIECEKSQEIKKEIVDAKEKAQKYDDLMAANSEIVQNNISHTEIYQENKKLRQNQKKSKKIGTLLLIGIISLCGIVTGVVLSIPWSLIAIGFGGPLFVLIKRLRGDEK